MGDKISLQSVLKYGTMNKNLAERIPMFFSKKPQNLNDQQTGSVSLETTPKAEPQPIPTAQPAPSTAVSQPVQPAPAQASTSTPAPSTAPASVYARPAQPTPTAETTPVSTPAVKPTPSIKLTQANVAATASADVQKILEKMKAPTATGKTVSPHVIKVPSLNSIFFPDLWLTPEGVMFIRDERTKFALVPLQTDDQLDFEKALEQGYTGSSSYALKFAGESYRVERVVTTTGVQYNCRKMPRSTPDIYDLGLPEPVINYLVGLATESGLILMGGPTGMGKTTTCSALIKKYLENEGGFLYTVEDPPEMPLDGLYPAKNGGLGLCKQTPIENERWGDGLKSALRSKPRYILVGEIRTPETASQALRAATSGHLVISTIHANSVEDALNSVIKYATAAGLQESLAADLLGRGILGVVHQKLEGIRVLKPVIRCAFANPNPAAADQMRMIIRDGKINLSTLMEMQETKLNQGKPLFKEIE